MLTQASQVNNDSQKQVNSRSSTYKNYIKTQIFLLFFGIFSVCGINFLVDPHAIFNILSVEGFNLDKPFAREGGQRRAKSVELLMDDYDTLILGNSRAGLFNPEHEVFDEAKTYNLSLPGSNIYEINKAFEYAVNHLDIDTVYLSLNFDMFYGNRKVHADYGVSRFKNSNNVSFVLSNLPSLFSLYALNHSLDTLLYNFKGESTEFPSNGFRRRTLPAGYEQYKVFKEKFESALSGSQFKNYEPARLNQLQQLIEYCKHHDIQLHLFIAPVHAQHLEVLSVMGKYSSREDWIRDLVRLTDSYDVTLWNFSGYNYITTERVPGPGEKGRMRWYLESSHFNENAANLILDTLSQNIRSSEPTDFDFGRVLTLANVDEHLSLMNERRAEYQLRIPTQLDVIENIYTATNQSSN